MKKIAWRTSVAKPFLMFWYVSWCPKLRGNRLGCRLFSKQDPALVVSRLNAFILLNRGQGRALLSRSKPGQALQQQVADAGASVNVGRMPARSHLICSI